MGLKVNWGKLKNALFINRNARQTVLKNTFWLTVSNAISRLIKAILIIYAARVLGTEGYGIFSYALSLAAFFAVFSDIGVSALVTREVARDRTALKRYFSAGLAIKSILIAVSAALIIFVAPHFTNVQNAIPLLPIAALLIAFDGFRDFIASITRSWERMELEATITVGTNVGITLVGLGILFVHGTPTALLWGYTIGSGLGLLLAHTVLQKSVDEPLIEIPRLAFLKKIILEAWPFALIGLLGTIMINTDTIIIGALRSAHELGLYAAAQRPILLLYIIPTIMSTALFPSFSRLAQGERVAFRSMLEKAITTTFLVSLPLAVGGIIVAQSLIIFLFGAAYAGATTTFALLLFTLVISFPQTLFTNAIFAHEKQRGFFALALGGALMNAVLDLILIPRYGIAGSAVATVTTQILVTGAMWQMMRRINPFSVFPKLRKIAAASILMGIVTAYFASHGVAFIPNLLASGITYVLLLLAFKEPLLSKVHSH